MQAKQFFKNYFKTTGVMPSQITTDKEPAFPDAITQSLGEKVKHRNSKCMDNRLEQHHRGTKSRIDVMKGFKDYWRAMIFCHSFKKIRQFFYIPNKTTAEKCRLFASKFHEFTKIAMMTA